MREKLVHAYLPNGFRLFNFVIPREGNIGIVGQNGLGKTTMMRILAGELIPNFGGESNKEKVLEFFQGTEARAYFEALYSGKIKVSFKPQYIEAVREYFKGTVKELVEKFGAQKLVSEFELEEIMDRKLDQISGGELQRVVTACALAKKAEMIFLDEPTSYLDVKQRLKLATIVKKDERRKIIVEHDLLILDFLADQVHIVYGKPSVYGIVSQAMSTRHGINTYLSGYLKEENVRFREYAIEFESKAQRQLEVGDVAIKWNKLVKRLDGFTLEVDAGEVREKEIIGIVGQNGLGKTTFAKMIANVIKPDEGSIDQAVVAYKPQYLERKEIKVGQLRIKSEIARQLNVDELRERSLLELSGGELQRVAIAECLSKEAEVYVLDEPSAYLDVEMRVRVAKLIRDRIKRSEKVAFVVDHDLMVIDLVADRIMHFFGKPAKEGKAKLYSLRDGMNNFLKEVGITVRRDPETNRPRINKPGSVKDREQREKGAFYYE